MNMSQTTGLLALSLAVAVSGCGDDARQTPLSIDEIYGPGGTEVPVADPIDYRNTATEDYGLPREGAVSIADLIAMYPETAGGRDQPSIFVGPDETFTTDQCRGGAPGVIDLPVVIEGVVTLHPRQFQKITICGQDERHYGSFVLEDDTGGIVILRDSRVANYNYGDRVRVTVRGIMLTFGPEPDTRAVLISDVEPAPQAFNDAGEVERYVLYEETEEPFSEDFMVANASRTFRVDGYIQQAPTNENFSQMIVTEQLYEPTFDGRIEGDMLQCTRSCEGTCRGGCASASVCADMCLTLCEDGGTSVADEDISTCWFVGLDVELGRRNYAPEYGRRVQVTGPVANSFDRQIWVGSTGQITFLDEE